MFDSGLKIMAPSAGRRAPTPDASSTQARPWTPTISALGLLLGMALACQSSESTTPKRSVTVVEKPAAAEATPNPDSPAAKSAAVVPEKSPPTTPTSASAQADTATPDDTAEPNQPSKAEIADSRPVAASPARSHRAQKSAAKPRHIPQCRHLGTRSEQWAWADSGEKIAFARCRGKQPVCRYSGTRSAGWYDDKQLIAYDRCEG